MSPPPQPRPLSEGEWPALHSAVNGVFRPQGGDLIAECPLLFDPANRGNLRVMVDTNPAAGGGAAVVAHAGFVVRDAQVPRRTIRVACVGAVFTTTRHRGRGLGSLVLSDALATASSGTDLILISGDRGLYRRQGFTPVPPLTEFRLPPVRSPAPAGQLELREAAVADVNAMAALYDAEDVHFLRPLDDWMRLWTAGRLVDAPARFWIVARAGRAVAYLVVQQATGQQPGGGKGRPRRVLEVAGDREAIVGTAPIVADELVVPSYDSATVDACQRQGWTPHERPFPVTARVLTDQVSVIPWYGLNYV